MKGMSFQNGVEYKITLEGETWSPGETLRGSIETKPASSAQVMLTDGVDKKVKLKSADAFVVYEEIDLKKTPFSFEFKLPLNARVSDKLGSLYLLYGSGEHLEKYGQLRVSIIPHLLLRDFSDLLVREFRFANPVFSQGKSKLTELKLSSPDLKQWSSLEQLIIQLNLLPETLEAHFQFHRKEIDPTKGALTTRLAKREVSRKWPLKELIHDFNQRLNKDFLQSEFEKVVTEYRDAGWLNS